MNKQLTKYSNREMKLSFKNWFYPLIVSKLNKKRALKSKLGDMENIAGLTEKEEKLERLFQQLRNCEEQYQNIFEKSPVGIVVVEPNTGAIVDANQVLLDILGYSLDELRQLTANNLIPRHFINETKVHLKKVEKHDRVTFEAECIQKDGSLVHVEITLNWNMYGDALPVIMAVVNDITERKKGEKELKQKNRELEQFAYLAAHDLKAPVANFYSLLSLLKDEDAVKEKSIGLFDKTFASVMQMQKTIKCINEVIDVKNNLDLKYEELKFHAVLEDVLIGIGNSIKKNGVKIDADFSLCETIHFPPVHLHSIFQNLLTNSIKYRKNDVAPFIKIWTRMENKTVCLVVKDNGKGIDMKTYGHKLFGLFQRFHLEEEGKGIGLHLTRAIVENNGGHIDVKSQPNMGAEFTIYLKQ